MCHAYWNIFWDRKMKWPLWHDFSPIVIFRIFICFKFLGRKRNRLAYRKVRQATKKTRNWENGGAKCSQNTRNTFSAKFQSMYSTAIDLKITLKNWRKMNFTFGVKIQTSDFYKPILHCLKITQNLAFLAFSANFSKTRQN